MIFSDLTNNHLNNPYIIITGKIIFHGRLAQLARAPRLHRGGRGFESLIAHHNYLL